jgi:hypothetical protein
MGRTLATLTLAALLTGCAGMQSGTPDENAVAALADAGDLGCTVLAIEGDPRDVAQAREAVTTARAVLATPTPTLLDLAAALAAAETDPRWAAISRSVVRRIKVRIGDTDPLPRDGVGFAMATAFVEACGQALGA